LPPRGIGDKTIQNLSELAQKNGLSMGETLLDLTRPNHPYLSELGRSGDKLVRFAHLLTNWRHAAQENTLSILFDRIIADTDYQSFIQDKSEEGLDRWENLLELRAVVMEYETRGLQDFFGGDGFGGRPRYASRRTGCPHHADAARCQGARV